MRYRRHEASIATAVLALGVVLALFAPGFFRPDNLVDLLMANVPVAIVAFGSMLVLITGEIDVSAGSVFALCSVAAGVLAKAGLPVSGAVLVAIVIGALAGAVNGALVAYTRIPSIVVTLATMVIWRDGLRWATQGAWVQGLPPAFQWMGLSATQFPIAVMAVLVILAATLGWGMTRLHAGRAIYATGSNAEAARLLGINVRVAKNLVFAAAGALTALGAVLNAVRFNQIPTNTGLGLELRVIAAVVVGGTAIAGGKGSVLSALFGVALLGMISPALTFLGASPYWEQALQGAILLTAVALDKLPSTARSPNSSATHAPA